MTPVFENIYYSLEALWQTRLKTISSLWMKNKFDIDFEITSDNVLHLKSNQTILDLGLEIGNLMKS